MLAAKFYDDQYYNNAYFGKVGGVPCDELNSLEVEFLFMCNFSFAVPPQQYEQYYTELFNHARQVNAGCSCHQQRARIPVLTFPTPDAGSKCSDLPAVLQEEKEPGFLFVLFLPSLFLSLLFSLTNPALSTHLFFCVCFFSFFQSPL